MAETPAWLSQYPEVKNDSWLDQYEEVKEKPFLDISDTASAVGRAVTSLPTTVSSSFSQAWEGLANPWKRGESYLKRQESMKALQEEMRQADEAAAASGDLSSVSSTIREAIPSLGFSGATLAPSIAAYGGALALTKSPTAAAGASAAASGLLAYRMAGAQFLDDARDRINDYFQKNLGRLPNEQEQEEAYQEILPLAQKFGVAEAGPEAIGNLALGGAGKYIRRALGGKNGVMQLASNALGKVTGSKAVLAGTGATLGEIGTEAVTGVEQERIQKQFEEGVMRGEAPESVAMPDRTFGDYAESFKEVAPTTLALTGLMGAAGLGPTAVARGIRALRPTPVENQTDAQRNIAAETGATMVDEVPPQTNEEKQAAMEAGGVTVVDPQGNTAVIAEPAQPVETSEETMRNPALEIAKEVGETSTANLAAIGSEQSAAAMAEFTATLDEIEAQAAQPPVQPSEEVEEAAEVAIQPPTIEAQKNAPSQEIIEESLRQEPQDRIESREAEEAGVGGELRGAEEGEGEVTTPQGKPTLATEGMVTPGGVATERDLTTGMPVFTRDEIVVSKPSVSRRSRPNGVDGESITEIKAPSKVTTPDNWSRLGDIDKLDATVEARLDFATGKVPKKTDKAWTAFAGRKTQKGRAVLARNVTYDEAIESAKDFVESANFQPASEQSGLGAGAATTPQGAIESPTAPQAGTSLSSKLEAATSRKEAEDILAPASIQQIKEAAQQMGYPATGSKKAIVSRLVAAVGSRADAKAIRQPSSQTTAAAKTETDAPHPYAQVPTGTKTKNISTAEFPANQGVAQYFEFPDGSSGVLINKNRPSYASDTGALISENSNPNYIEDSLVKTDQLSLVMDGMSDVGTGHFSKDVLTILKRDWDFSKPPHENVRDALVKFYKTNQNWLEDKFAKLNTPGAFIGPISGVASYPNNSSVSTSLRGKDIAFSFGDSYVFIDGAPIGGVQPVGSLGVAKGGNVIGLQPDFIKVADATGKQVVIASDGVGKAIWQNPNGTIKEWINSSESRGDKPYDDMAVIDLRKKTSQTTAAANETPAPLAEGAGAAGASSSLEGGRSSELPQESPKTAIESTEKSLEKEGYGAKLNAVRKSIRDLGPDSQKAQTQALNDLMAMPLADLQSAFEVLTGIPTKLANKRQLANNVLNEILAESRNEKLPEADETFRKAEIEAEEEIQRQNAQSLARIFNDKLRTKPVKGTVTAADAEQAIGQLQNSGEVPGAIFTWRGTAKELQRLAKNPAFRQAFPGVVKNANNQNAEGWFENGMAFVITDQVVVTDLDRARALVEGTTATVAAVKRVISHENYHKGVALLSPKDQAKLVSLLRKLFPAAELDDLAKSYKQYADWRTNRASEYALLEEKMQKAIEEMKEVPRDGLLRELIDFLKSIWRKWTGQPKGEPRLRDLKDVVRLLRSTLKDAHKAQANRTANGGRVMMSLPAFRNFVPAVQINGRIETGASHYEAWLKHAIRQIPNYKKDGLSDAEVKNLADKWLVDHPEVMANSMTKEGFMTDEGYLNRQDSLKKFLALGGKQRLDPGEVRDWLDSADVDSARMSLGTNMIDAEYLEAVANGDMEKAQRMVDEAAKAAGYNEKLYRGDKEAYAEFKPSESGTESERANHPFGIYLTNSKKYASAYGIPRLFWVKTKNFVGPYQYRQLAEKEGRQYASVLLATQGFDGVGFRPLMGEKMKRIGWSEFVSFESSKIKSADPVTYDDAGNVIPLSQRFQPSSPDIRFSLATPVEYSSTNNELASSAQQTARNIEYTPRQLEVHFAVRKAYDAMPKDNGVAVPLFELFDKTKELVPDLNAQEFSEIVQGLYDDNAALLHKGDSEFAIFNRDSEPASSVVILPGKGMASLGTALSPQDYARHAELEAKNDAGTITDAERREAEALVEKAAMAEEYIYSVQHGTHRDFSVFDVTKGKSRGDRFEMNNWGIWTTEDDASIYGPKVLKLYGKSKSPLRVQTFEDWFDDYVKHAYPIFYYQGITADELAKDLQDVAGSYFKRKKDIPANITRTEEYRQMLADQPGAAGYSKSLKDRGFDSVLIEGGFLDGQLQTVRVYLDPSQIKSAETFTGVPLAQRFDVTSPDIRFSYGAPDLSAAQNFHNEVKVIAQGLPVGGEYQGRKMKGIEKVEDHAKFNATAMGDAAERLLTSLSKDHSLEEIFELVQQPDFQRELGLFDPEMNKSNAAKLTYLKVLAQLKQRAWNAENKARTDGQRIKANVLYRQVSQYYANLTTGGGQYLQSIQDIHDDPRSRFAFEIERYENAMTEANAEAVENQAGPDGMNPVKSDINIMINTSGKNATADVLEEVEEDQDAIDLAEGEATLDGEDKSLWEKVKDWLREIGAATRQLRAFNTGGKASLSSEQRNAIAGMSREELVALIADRKKKVNAALKKLLGEESDAKTPEQKRTRKKREKMVQTARKRVDSGKDVDPKPSSDPTMRDVLREINKARREIPGANQKPIQWAEILRQSPKSTEKTIGTEEYRKRIFDAMMASDAFKDLSDEQKEKLADMFSQAWEKKRQAILDKMLDTYSTNLDAAKEKRKLAKALKDSRNQLLELVNLGAYTDDELVRVIGEKFGLKTEFTAEEKAKLRDLAEKLQDDTMNTAKRNKLAFEYLYLLQSSTKIPASELISMIWVTSVLNGGGTIVSIALSFVNGFYNIAGNHFARAYTELVRGNPKQAVDIMLDTFKAMGRWLKSYGPSAERAWNYLWTGDRSLLESAANDPFSNVRTLADVEKHQANAERLAKDPNLVKQYIGKYLRFWGRLLTALDAFNVMTNKAGSLAIAMRQSGLTSEQIKEIDAAHDMKVFKQRIIETDPFFNGKPPTDSFGRSYLTSLAEAAMYASLAKMGVQIENADYMAAESAFTMNPTGVGGIFYNFVKGLDAKATLASKKFLKNAEAHWAKEKNWDTGWEMFLAHTAQFMAYQVVNAFGLRFARFAGNKFNQGLSFIPGVGLLRRRELSNENLKGREQAFIDSIRRNQIAGLIMLVGGMAILKAIADEPDDEKRGWGINGGFNNLTPDQNAQMLAQGKKRYTITIGDYSWSYQNWVLSQPLAAIGAMSDMIRFSPDKWKEKNAGDKVISGALSGLKATLEIPALTQVGELLGTGVSSKDPTEQTQNRLVRALAGWSGGFMPRFLKDIDYMAEPTMRKYETFWQRASSHIPVYRRYTGKDFYDILGNPVEKNAIPGSREFAKLDERPEYQIMGALNSRGIWLTPANAEYRMIGKGRNRRRLTQEEADAYSLESGKEYRKMLLRYGARALRMTPVKAKDYISDLADKARDRALDRVARR